MGRPKEQPYRLRQYKSMMEEALRSPISVKDLKINGGDLISELKLKPGKKIGYILDALMGITLYEPEKNNKKFLLKKAEELSKLSDDKLLKLANIGKDVIQKAEEKEIKKIHKRNKIK